jgi:hypothetical protein
MLLRIISLTPALRRRAQAARIGRCVCLEHP